MKKILEEHPRNWSHLAPLKFCGTQNKVGSRYNISNEKSDKLSGTFLESQFSMSLRRCGTIGYLLHCILISRKNEGTYERYEHYQ